MLLFTVAALSSLAVYATFALETSTGTIDSTSTRRMRSAVSTTTFPTVSLWLPMGGPPGIQASVISASPNETAYALGCTNDDSNSECAYAGPITITEGQSTVVFTNTFGGEGMSMPAEPITVQCMLVGATLEESPIIGATSAVCTSSSAVAGLGVAVSTSTLASTQINYTPVEVTAGVQKLLGAATMTQIQGTTTDRSKGAAPAKTAVAQLRLGGAVWMAVLGVL